MRNARRQGRRRRAGRDQTRPGAPEVTGEVGRSQAVSTYGVGSIYELRTSTRNGQALNSVMMAGLDFWDASELTPIREHHLEKVLGVRSFLEPPHKQDEDQASRPASQRGPHVPAVRFPNYLECERCHRLGTMGREFEERGLSPRCRDTDCDGRGVPVRLIMACYPKDEEDQRHPGHVEDFPWRWWAHSKTDNGVCDSPQLKLLSRAGGSAGLAGMRVVCENPECKKRDIGRSLADVFRSEEFRALRCRGNRPWLCDSEQCDRPLRTLMRGASNVYFAVTVSALSIPPNSSFLLQRIGSLRSVMNSYRSFCMGDLVRFARNSDARLGRYSDEQIADAIRANADDAAGSGPSTFDEQRRVERVAIVEERSDEDAENSDFVVERVPDGNLGQRLGEITRHLVRAKRLREVRALRGFHRVEPVPSTDPYGVECAPLARGAVREVGWLPGIEVRGEGIYFELDPDRVQAWSAREAVVSRHAMLRRNIEEHQARKGRSIDPQEMPSARFVLMHTLAHLLINQLALDCGYSSAALRERLYVGGDTEAAWNGLLVYTASPGADGTLGGLVRQGEPDIFERTLRAALSGALWCSSDPLCIESTGQGTDALNLAACHACCITSETSCEQRNIYLDRALLVGTLENPDIGFFTGCSLLQE